MEFSARQIADILQGNVEGDDNAVVTDLSKIEEGRPNTLTFLANPAYTEFIYKTEATVAIVSAEFKPEKPLPSSLTLVKVADARLAFGKLLEAYSGMMKPEPGIDKTASIASGAQVADSAFIGPFVVIEAGAQIGEGAQINAHAFIGASAIIGKNTILLPRTYVGHRCVIGDECMLQPGAIIGGDGFGFAPNAENQYQKVIHVGNVILEDYVEIGANTTIDRATLGSTIIRKGVKLDNLIQVAHNVEIGENTVIAAQTGVAGSTKIGKNCMIGGQVGIIGHLTIADEVKIAAQSGVGKSITEKGQIVQGSPALPIGDYKRSYVYFRKLHKMADSIDQLKKNILKLDKNG
jgi:UDP-3-O-[3-hydroxymyristoyl] glucosamine N-acyltransferase